MDLEWYRGRYGFAGGRLDAVDHYLNVGAALGWDPHPLFSTRWYLRCSPDVRASGQNPLHHYLTVGCEEGRWPHPLVDPTSPAMRDGVRRSHRADLEVYASTPSLWSEKPSALFDGAWYLERYPDVRASGWNPLRHFVVHGEHEGRWPNPLFDPSHYLRTFTGEVTPDIGLLAHYMHAGWRDSRSTIPGIDPEWIRLRYDLSTDPLAHALDELLPTGRPLRPEDEVVLVASDPSIVHEVLGAARGLAADDRSDGGSIGPSSGVAGGSWIQRAVAVRAPFLAEWASGIHDDSTAVRMHGAGDVDVGLAGTHLSSRWAQREPSPGRCDPHRERRRVLLISHEASLTGAPTYLEQVGVVLERAGHDVIVLSLNDDPRTEVFERCGLPHMLLREAGGADPLQRAMNEDWSLTTDGRSWLSSFLAGYRPDVALVNTVRSAAACERLFAADVPYVLLVHERTGFDPTAGAPFDHFSRLLRAAFVAAEVVLFGSSDTQSVWQWPGRMPYGEVALPWRALTGMPDPSDPSRFRTAHDITDHDFVYVSVGSLEPRKRILDVIRAFAAIKDADVRLLIVGDDEADAPVHREFREEVRAAAADDPRVLLLPRMSNPAAAYRASDCFVMASELETFPLVLQEAQLYALSIITSRFPGWEELPSSDSMTTFEVGDVYGLAVRMTEARHQHADRRVERERVREHMESLAKQTNGRLSELLLRISTSSGPRLATREWLHRG
jgi:glycosyltransferase involved in cell wall biosynthesis